jgi:hypothetical protein
MLRAACPKVNETVVAMQQALAANHRPYIQWDERILTVQ